MNFDFSDEQKMLRDQARRFLDDASGIARVRQWMTGNDSFDRDAWKQIAGMGWTGAAIPEAQGGLGLGALELCVLCEELGRALTPVPFFGTVCISAELLKLAPPSAARDALLERIAAGDAVVALAACADGTVALPADPPQAHDGRLTGTVPIVADLPCATDLLVIASDGGRPVLALLAADAAGVARRALAGFDTLRPHGRLELDAAAYAPLWSGAELEQALARVCDAAAVFAAFEQIGGADSALLLARDYALQRFAFGRPIGGNQAVKHRLADMLVRIELARSNAYYGAWAAESGPGELGRAAAAARLSATEAYSFAAEECLHLHGGIGYTWEADCHFFYRRARLLAVSLGEPALWSERLVRACAAEPAAAH